MTDHDVDELINKLKPFFMRLVRGFALALLTFVLGIMQPFISFSSLALPLAVFIFGVSNYAARFAYFIALYLTILLLIDPSSWAATKRFMEMLAYRLLSV